MLSFLPSTWKVAVVDAADECRSTNRRIWCVGTSACFACTFLSKLPTVSVGKTKHVSTPMSSLILTVCSDAALRGVRRFDCS